MKKFHPEIKEIADRFYEKKPHVKAGHMFGYPAYYVGKKLIACHYGDGLALKLPEASAIHLLSENNMHVEPFSPMGKKMGKHWVIVFNNKLSKFNLPDSFLQETIEFALNRWLINV